VWRGSELARAGHEACVPSGFAALDAELPGGGWPTRALSELLLPQPGACEWRLLGPALRRLLAPPVQAATSPGRSRRPRAASAGANVKAAHLPQLLLINPPWTPHLPGLAEHGIAPQQLIWIAPASHAQALWAAEQAIKADVAAAVLAWLPEARPEQMRRLQAAALGARTPVFVLRPAAQAQSQSSAAPLRLLLEPGPRADALRLRLIKRRGPAHEQWLALDATLPAGLDRLLPPRLLAPVHEPSGATAPSSVPLPETAPLRPRIDLAACPQEFAAAMPLTIRS
jgi:protein ImuA